MNRGNVSRTGYNISRIRNQTVINAYLSRNLAAITVNLSWCRIFINPWIQRENSISNFRLGLCETTNTREREREWKWDENRDRYILYIYRNVIMSLYTNICIFSLTFAVYYGKILLVIRQKREEGIDIGQTNHAGLHGVIRKLSTSLARALMWFTGPTPPAPCFRIILARITIYLFDIGVSSSPHTPTRSPTTFITMHPWSYYEGRPSWHTHSSRTNTNITPYVYVFIIDISVCIFLFF